MSLDLLEGPAVEPVSLSDAKAHLRVDGTAEDAFISTLIITSRLHVEAALGIALVSQRWAWRIDAWPASGGVVLPLRPMISVDAVRVTPATGSPVVVDAATYLVDGGGNPTRLVPKACALPAPGVPIQGIEIELTAGFGDGAEDVPAPIRQAILLLIAHWYENREPVAIDAKPANVPAMVSELLQPYRTVRL
jgi:uncharacterized phiE125 gp8 family phage protein